MELTYNTKFVFGEIPQNEIKKAYALCDDYRAFLDSGKTERECVTEAEKLALEKGFIPLSEKEKLLPGDKVYAINREKNIILAVIGNDIEDGMNIVGAHIDSPRLDLKQNPLYEADDIAMFKTHYYGGIKKYQWTTIPLAIHGVIFTADGEKKIISVGEDENDPVFCITDLLPHLGKDQMSKKLSDAIEGEALNIVVGGVKADGADKEAVKLNVLQLLNAKYGITERDFISAEIEVVPAFKAKNVGFDGAFVGAYGQDDRVCAYTALRAIFEIEKPERTSVCLFVDKEEIGSMGNTGMLSANFEMTVCELITKIKGSCDMLTFNNVIKNSMCLSSDVGIAVDPNYESVSEKNNSAFTGRGMVLSKYTGARGKSGSNDANAEFVNKVCRRLDADGIFWQTTELGKVDQGGGGTIAQFVANLNIDVIDCGVPVLSMHSPFELTHKADIYMAYRSYVSFFGLNR